MHQRTDLGNANLWRVWTVVVATIMAAFVAPSVRADFILSAQTVSAAAGSSGNTLEVTLQNTGTTAVDFGGFNFTLAIASADITVTDVTTSTSTATYIFNGDSVFGPSIATSLTSPITASDLSFSGTSVAAGATVGLGQLRFDVASGAVANTVSVVFAPFPGSSLSGPTGNDIPVDQLVNGQINLTGSTAATPTPSAVLGGSVLFGFLGVLTSRRRAMVATQKA